MNYKHIMLVGGLLLATSLTADAQRRGGWRGGNFGGVGISFGVGPSYGYNNFGYGRGTGFNNFGYSPYGYNNFGYGRGVGFGNNSYYGGSPYYYGRSNYVTPSYYSTPTYSYSTPTYSYGTPSTYVTPQYVTPATYSSQGSTFVSPASGTAPAGSEWGLRITELPNGNAKTAGLEMGDIILKADGNRTQTFEDLRNVLRSTSKKVVEVEYIDAASGRTQVQNVAVSDTRIGVTVEETTVTIK